LIEKIINAGGSATESTPFSVIELGESQWSKFPLSWLRPQFTLIEKLNNVGGSATESTPFSVIELGESQWSKLPLSWLRL
jgi:hypothetical protein